MNIRIILISSILGVTALTSCRRPVVEAEDPTVKIAASLRDVSRLSLVEMSVNKVGTISDSGATGFASLLNMLKFGDRVGVYSYHTYLEAYIDLSALEPGDLEVDPARRFVKVRLPEVEVRISGRDATVTEEHYRVTGLRSSISPSERARLKELMNSAVRSELRQNDTYGHILLDDARHKAAGYISALLASMGYNSEVTFR